MNIDDEIRQDFLIEAGELYDLLNDQLVELEKNPQDTELLNAIFRSFHTIKGGAGFLELTQMVEVCHRAEDVFDLLRKDEIGVDAELISVFFEVLDVVGDMFERLREDEQLQAADISLLNQLDSYLHASTPLVVDEDRCNKIDVDQGVEDGDAGTSKTMDDEFEQMRNTALNGNNNESKGVQSNDLITEDEFDDLLDEIHGKGKHKVITEQPVSEKQSSDNAGPSELITDDEFEKLLDDMHGKNKGPGSHATKPLEAVYETTGVSGDHIDVINDGSQSVESDAKPSDNKISIKKESSVRVDTERLDDIMNLVGELVLARNRLSMLKQGMKQGHVTDAISTLELVTTDLQSSIMKTRMQPIKKVFNRFPRLIRDLAKKLGKDINLELIGEETDLDKCLVESLADPLIHLVRNSADHGIEKPEERYAAGKPRQGTITLSAQQEGDRVLLTVTDDGKGMDHHVFRKKAVDSGMMTEDAAKHMSDKDVYNLIFAPGFSTKSEISDVSGRGVGMDVVKTRINELNGSIEIDSTLGKGSVITMHLPLTLAILPTLMVLLDSYQFALPLNNVYEAFNMDPDMINIVDSTEVIRVRGETLPLFYLYPWLVRDSEYNGPDAHQKVIVVKMGSTRFCLVVDKIVGQEEVVIKPLGAMLNTTEGFSGATITGDGNIALVLDMPSLMEKYTSNRVSC